MGSITIVVDGTTAPEQLAQYRAILDVLVLGVTKISTVDETEKRPKTTKGKPTKVKEPEKEEEEENFNDEPGEYTLQDVRKAVSTILQETGDKHRKAIAAKLKKFGADRTANLDEKHFGDFMEFIETLK